MVIRELLKKAEKTLVENGIEDSHIEASVLFAYVLNKSKTYLYTHMDDTVDDSQIDLFENYVKKRSGHMPVAYIVGRAWFMSLELHVNESTLVPRPETEGLVEETLSCAAGMPGDPIKLLDWCTGSGCIGIAAAYHNQRVKAILSDINPDSIEIAEKNINKYHLADRVKTRIGNLYDPVPKKKFDIITANPPYIPSTDIQSLDSDVRDYEPLSALDGGTDGLDFYRWIISGAPDYLSPGGIIVLEAGIGLSKPICNILTHNNFSNVAIKNDIGGIPRIITASYPKVSLG
ncbi:MAG: peptide chain release factor N(5)-glutamine methyltransferase [Clostridia bacterium]|nr:peptide chain release factor N(5)-glutamine methyltransferase [Clostridia bacterium]